MPLATDIGLIGTILSHIDSLGARLVRDDGISQVPVTNVRSRTLRADALRVCVAYPTVSRLLIGVEHLGRMPSAAYTVPEFRRPQAGMPSQRPERGTA